MQVYRSILRTNWSPNECVPKWSRCPTAIGAWRLRGAVQSACWCRLQRPVRLLGPLLDTTSGVMFVASWIFHCPWLTDKFSLLWIVHVGPCRVDNLRRAPQIAEVEIRPEECSSWFGVKRNSNQPPPIWRILHATLAYGFATGLSFSSSK